MSLSSLRRFLTSCLGERSRQNEIASSPKSPVRFLWQHLTPAPQLLLKHHKDLIYSTLICKNILARKNVDKYIDTKRKFIFDFTTTQTKKNSSFSTAGFCAFYSLRTLFIADQISECQKRGKKGILYCHEQPGIVLPMLSAFKVLKLEFLNVRDEKQSIDCD